MVGKKIAEFPSLDILTSTFRGCYEIVEDAPSSDFRVEDLEFISFMEPGDDGSVKVDVVRRRAVGLKGNFTLADGIRIMQGHDKIDPALCGKIYIFLTATVLCGPGGHLYIPYIFWNGAGWSVSLCHCKENCPGKARLSRIK